METLTKWVFLFFKPSPDISGRGINWAPPLWVWQRAEPLRGSSVAAELFPMDVSSQPWEDVCSPRVLPQWSHCGEPQGRLPLSLGGCPSLQCSWALTKNRSKVIRKRPDVVVCCTTLAIWDCSCGMPAFPSTGCATPFIMISKGRAALAIEKGLEQSFLLEPGKGQPGMRRLQFPLGLLSRSAGCRRGQHGWSWRHLALDQGVQQPLMHSIASPWWW